jgi:hypothetical protein
MYGSRSKTQSCPSHLRLEEGRSNIFWGKTTPFDGSWLALITPSAETLNASKPPSLPESLILDCCLLLNGEDQYQVAQILDPSATSISTSSSPPLPHSTWR